MRRLLFLIALLLVAACVPAAAQATSWFYYSGCYTTAVQCWSTTQPPATGGWGNTQSDNTGDGFVLTDDKCTHSNSSGQCTNEQLGTPWGTLGDSCQYYGDAITPLTVGSSWNYSNVTGWSAPNPAQEQASVGSGPFYDVCGVYDENWEGWVQGDSGEATCYVTCGVGHSVDLPQDALFPWGYGQAFNVAEATDAGYWTQQPPSDSSAGGHAFLCADLLDETSGPAYGKSIFECYTPWIANVGGGTHCSSGPGCANGYNYIIPNDLGCSNSVSCGVDMWGTFDSSDPFITVTAGSTTYATSHASASLPSASYGFSQTQGQLANDIANYINPFLDSRGAGYDFGTYDSFALVNLSQGMECWHYSSCGQTEASLYVNSQ